MVYHPELVGKEPTKFLFSQRSDTSQNIQERGHLPGTRAGAGSSVLNTPGVKWRRDFTRMRLAVRVAVVVVGFVVVEAIVVAVVGGGGITCTGKKEVLNGLQGDYQQPLGIDEGVEV